MLQIAVLESLHFNPIDVDLEHLQVNSAILFAEGRRNNHNAHFESEIRKACAKKAKMLATYMASA